MKQTLAASSVLALVIATPAFGQSYDHSIGSGNLAAWPYVGKSVQSQHAAPTLRHPKPRGVPAEAYAKEPVGAVPVIPQLPEYDGQGALFVPSGD